MTRALGSYGALTWFEILFESGGDGRVIGCRDPGFAFIDEKSRVCCVFFLGVSVWVVFMEVA